MPTFVGVDPGRTGSICLLNTKTDDILFSPTPARNAKIRTTRIWGALFPLDVHYMTIAIEDVHSLHMMSAKSNFGFGYNVGAVHALFDCLGATYELVTPKVWQKAVGAPSSKSVGGPKGLKQAIAKLAIDLYPGAQLHGPKGGLLDGRTDALMIAHYLKLKHGG